MQIIGFYFLALLYTRISKFGELEKKQQKLMREMDDAIAVYLNEIKDENDKLIEKLTTKFDRQNQTDNESSKLVGTDVKTLKNEAEPEIHVTMPQKTTFHHARQSYEAFKQHASHEQQVVDDRTRIMRLYADGMSVEEIAKALGKGRTEVELILKFK